MIFESPHRIIKTVNDLILYFGKERRISISRELTKIHEENFRGNLLEALFFLENNKPKGEFVILVSKKNYKMD